MVVKRDGRPRRRQSKSKIPQFNNWIDEAQSHVTIKLMGDQRVNVDTNGCFYRAEHVDVFANLRVQLTGAVAPYDEWTDAQDCMVGRWIHHKHLLGSDDHSQSWFVPVTREFLERVINRRLFIFGICQ